MSQWLLVVLLSGVFLRMPLNGEQHATTRVGRRPENKWIRCSGSTVWDFSFTEAWTQRCARHRQITGQDNKPTVDSWYTTVNIHPVSIIHEALTHSFKNRPNPCVCIFIFSGYLVTFRKGEKMTSVRLFLTSIRQGHLTFDMTRMRNTHISNYRRHFVDPPSVAQPQLFPIL